VGIALGICMLMLGVNNASNDLLTRDFHESGANLYVLASGGKLVPLLPGESPGTIQQARHMLGLVRTTPGVNGAIGTLSWSLERERPGPKQRDEPTELLGVLGVEGDPAAIRNSVVLTQGRWLGREDEVVLGSRLSRETGLGLGDILRLSGRDFRVVGIGRLRGVGLSGGSLAYLDMRPLWHRAPVGGSLNIIMAESSQPDLVRQRLMEIDGFRVLDPLEAVAEADAALATSRVGRGIFIGLTLAIAGLFVANVLSRSVAERRLEFATLKAIGIPNGTILAIVAGQALLVSLPAGVLAIGVSTALGAGINGYLAPAYDLERLYAVDAQLFATVFALSVVLGAVAGLVPALRARRVDPVEVLREA